MCLARGKIARQHGFHGVGPGEVLAGAVRHREIAAQDCAQISLVVRPRKQHEGGVLHERPINDGRQLAVGLEIAEQADHFTVSQKAES